MITLTPPQLAPENIKEKISCIRSHRERIFNTSLQVIADKLILHNYGHGGAGWTFLFGCVAETINLYTHYLQEHPHLKSKPVTVIGAGCYGLLTAIQLARQGQSVRIVAHDIANCTSHKAAGFFFPRPRACSTPQECATFVRLGLHSYQEYLQIAQGTHPFITAGARLLPAYYSRTIDPGFTPYIHAGLMRPPVEQTITFGNHQQYPVMAYNTLFIDAATMMQQLHAQLRALHIPIIQQQVNNFDELPEAIIFNCSGFGAQHLTNDPRLVPVQGHLITLRNQPHQTQHYMINVQVASTDPRGRPRTELIYYAPKDEGILGITFLRGQNSPTANAHEFERLLERCRHFFCT